MAKNPHSGYVFDADALIQLKEFYPLSNKAFDFIWNNLLDRADSGEVKIEKHVIDQILVKDGELSTFVTDHKDRLILQWNQEMQNFYEKEVIPFYKDLPPPFGPALVDSDPFVIASAKITNRIVVTQEVHSKPQAFQKCKTSGCNEKIAPPLIEKSQTKPPKIPSVCARLGGIKCIAIESFLNKINK